MNMKFVLPVGLEPTTLGLVVVSEGFQPSTYGVGDHCSMQLS